VEQRRISAAHKGWQVDVRSIRCDTAFAVKAWAANGKRIGSGDYSAVKAVCLDQRAVVSTAALDARFARRGTIHGGSCVATYKRLPDFTAMKAAKKMVDALAVVVLALDDSVPAGAYALEDPGR
jgi:hypothetical protein